jgi:hypothetical protein
MGISELFSLIALVIAISALIGPLFSAFFTRRNTRHQALIDVHKDFRSPEMKSALDDLWNFYHECEASRLTTNPVLDSIPHLKRSYENKVIGEKNLPVEKTLSYKRRLLMHFYFHLASIYKHKILPDKMIFDWWVPDDFKCFDFLLPLEEKESELHKINSNQTAYVLEPLKKLREKCIAYYNN